KGYEGHFLCGDGHPGKLRDSMYAHFQETLQDQTHIPPFYLTTYSHWKDEDRPYVKCDFKTRYDSRMGFLVERMEVKRANLFGTIKMAELRPNKNEDIPTCESANALVGHKKRSLKL